jgi:hypothetical protein
MSETFVKDSSKHDFHEILREKYTARIEPSEHPDEVLIRTSYKIDTRELVSILITNEISFRYYPGGLSLTPISLKELEMVI